MHYTHLWQKVGAIMIGVLCHSITLRKWAVTSDSCKVNVILQIGNKQQSENNVKAHEQLCDISTKVTPTKKEQPALNACK